MAGSVKASSGVLPTLGQVSVNVSGYTTHRGRHVSPYVRFSGSPNRAAGHLGGALRRIGHFMSLKGETTKPTRILFSRSGKVTIV